jgi:excisionase family DNA binding protein
MQRKVKTAKPAATPTATPTATPDDLWKKPKVCQRLAISRRNLDYKLSRGEIPYVRIGGSVRFLQSDIDNLIKFSRVGGGAKSKIRKGGASP